MPLLDLTRRPDWEPAYIGALEAADALPFGYGKSEIDCLRRVAAVCEAMTGIDPMRGHRAYGTETGAFKCLSKAGCSSVEDALRMVFPETTKLRTMRGDCGVLAQQIGGHTQLTAFVIIQNHMASAKGPDGLTIVSVDRLSAVFAVGAR